MAQKMMDIGSLFYETIHVCLDDKALKIVQVKMIAGKRQVAGIYYQTIEGLSIEQISSQIRLGIASFKTQVKRVSVILPSRYAITKNIEVPSLDKEEIENIIRLQAIRHTPYSKQEVIVGHITLERILERYTKVLLVIVANENVRKKTDVVELAGFEIEAIHLSSDTLVRFVNEYQLLAGMEPPIGLTYVDSDSTDLVVVSAGKPYFIRSIPIGLQQIEKDAAVASKQLADEFKKTCEAYQNEDQGIPIKKFMVLGTQNAVLTGALQEACGIPAELLSVKDKSIYLPEVQAKLDSLKTVNFLDVYADGLVGQPASMDLLPDDLKVRKSFRQKGKEIFIASIFIMIMIVLIIGVFLTKIYFRNNYLNEITHNFETKQKEAEELDRISEETRFARDFSKKRGVSLKVIDEFQKILPEDMYLSEMALTEDNKVSIKGTSNLMSTVFSFVTELENSPEFKTVTSDYTKSRKENDKDVSDFGLSAVLENA